jgi:transcriptional regulator with GAF, ATPase, and Fis domain
LYDPIFMDPEVAQKLAEILGQLAVEMQAQTGADATLRTISAAAVQNIPGASWAGISLVNGRTVRPAIPTDVVVEELDKLQTELAEGPALSAILDHHTIHIADLPNETRWPQFAATAAELGVHAILSFRLFVDAGNIGALNIYGASPYAFTEDSIAIGEVLAQHAAVAMAGVAAEEQFHTALASRDIIGQAKGILMHRDNLTGLQAFALLARASQETNTKLVDVARFLVAEHEHGTKP